jgi:hypothetical protein
MSSKLGVWLQGKSVNKCLPGEPTAQHSGFQHQPRPPHAGQDGVRHPSPVRRSKQEDNSVLVKLDFVLDFEIVAFLVLNCLYFN